eukprot:6647306-Ditylum_brightwellii.AAC.1
MEHGLDQHRAAPCGDVRREGFGLEDSVVTAIMLDVDVEVLCITLESVLCIQCVVGVERHLVAMEEEGAHVICDNSPATEFGRLSLLTSGVR